MKWIIFIILLLVPITFGYDNVTRFEGDVAYVNDTIGLVSQQPYIIDSGTEATVSFENRLEVTSYIACIRAPVSVNIDDIKFEYIKKTRAWWWDDDLKQVTRVNNRIKCMKAFTNSDLVEIKFKARYLGEGTIKYDIFIYPSVYGHNIQTARNNGHLIVVDPYLIGDLGSKSSLLTHFSFSNNLTDISTTYNNQVINTTQVLSTSTSGTELIRTTNVSDQSPNTLVRNYTGHYFYTGSFEYDVKIEFEYETGTRVNTSTQHVASTNLTLTFGNPRPNLPVNVLRTYFILTGAAQAEANATVNLVKNNITRRYYIQNNGTSGYNYRANQNSSDIFSQNHSIDTNMTYNGSGAVFNGGTGLWSSNGINTTLFQGFMDDDFTLCSRFTLATKIHGGDVMGNFEGASGGCMQIYDNSISEMRFFCNNGSGASAVNLGDINIGQEYFMCSGRNSTNLWASLDNGIRLSGVDRTNLGSVSSNNHIFVGYEFNFNRVWNGTIAEAYIYNESLSEGEVIKLFNKGNYTSDIASNNLSAIYLSGNDYVTLTNNDIGLYNFTSVNEITISFWMKPNDITNTQYPLSQRDETFFLLQNGKINFNIQVIGNVQSTGSLITDKWYHIVGRHDGSEMSIWIDGIKNNTLTTSASFTSSNDFKIGNYKNRDFFTGTIDEVLIYSTALNDVEVSNLFGGFNNSLNITLLDAETFALLNTETITVNLFNDNTNYSDSTTTNTGFAFFNGASTGTLRIRAFSDNYDANTLLLDLTDSNAQHNVTMYLTNATSTSIKDVMLNVDDEVGAVLPDAEVRIFAQNANTGMFFLTTSIFTDINGQKLVQLVRDSVFYKFTIFLGDSKCYETSNAFTVSASTDSLTFRCIVGSQYIENRNAYDDINFTLIADNTSNVTGWFRLEAITAVTGEICLKVFRDPTRENVLVNESCVNGTSLLTTINVNSTNDTRNSVYNGIMTWNPRDFSIETALDSVSLFFYKAAQRDWSSLGLILYILLTIFIFMMLIKYPTIAVMVPGAMFALATWTGLIRITQGKSLGIIAIGICAIIAWAIETRNR